jgi:hypothetical protein
MLNDEIMKKNQLHEKISNKKIAIKRIRMKIKIKNKLEGKNNFLIEG